MSDECTCEKCQAATAKERRASVWPVLRSEPQDEGRGRPQRNLYLVVTDAGISLRQQSSEL